MAERERPLQIPLVEPLQFERNFIRSAVCELRFPVLLEFNDKTFASSYEMLRKRYPHLDRGMNVSIGVKEEREAQYTLRSRDKRWVVVVKPSSMTVQLEGHYVSWRDMLAQILPTAEVLQSNLDVEFFTRIGLRYSNLLPVGDDPRGWVNQRLLTAMESAELGDLGMCLQEMRGRCAGGVGQFFFRHGFSSELPTDSGKRLYLLDIDTYEEDVEPEKLPDLLSVLNRNSYAIFQWSIGPTATGALGQKVEQQ